MAWPKSDEKKTETITLKVSARQARILQRYAEIKELTEPEALRRMIDGAADFVAKHDSGPPQATVATGDVSINGGQSITSMEDIESKITNVEAHSGQESLGYIGGRLNVGLPGGSYSDDGEDMPGDGG